MENVMPRGCKPGQKHSGHFSKGFDPRRNLKGGYLMRERATVEQKFREHTETALKALLAVLEDKEAPHKDVWSCPGLFGPLQDRIYKNFLFVWKPGGAREPAGPRRSQEEPGKPRGAKRT